MAFSKIWWFVNENGQRIGFMDPIEFESILAGYYGDKVWVRLFSEDFGFSCPTIYRWNQGLTPIPRNVAMCVLMLAKLGGPKKLPTLNTPWLPNPGEDEPVPRQPKAVYKKKPVEKERAAKRPPVDFGELDKVAARA